MNNDKNIKKSIASANINFLVGSGVSMPFFKILTDIEKKLSEAEKSGDLDKEIEIKKEYFNGSISNNRGLLEINSLRSQKCQDVLGQYKEFYKNINGNYIHNTPLTLQS